MEGKVLSNINGTYLIYTPTQIYKSKSRGVIRNKKQKIEVGDNVVFNPELNVIENILERKNYIIRPSMANIDLILVVESIKEPLFSYLLTFKHLTYANKNNIPFLLVISKIDNDEDYKKYLDIKNVFSLLGVEILPCSKFNPSYIESIKEKIKGKTICLLGQSGVGKSSLINLIDENFSRDEGEYSKSLGRGKHKTKEVVLLPYLDGFIADTPGFSSLDLMCYKEELAIYFPGFQDYNKCFYPSCLHISENKCYIKNELNSNKIPKIAYDCYLKLSSEAIFKKERFNKHEK